MFIRKDKYLKMKHKKDNIVYYIIGSVIFILISYAIYKYLSANNLYLSIFKFVVLFESILCALIFLLLIIDYISTVLFLRIILYLATNLFLIILYAFLFPIGLIDVGYRLITNDDYTDINGMIFFLIKIGITMSIIYAIHCNYFQKDNHLIVVPIIVIFFILYGSMQLLDRFILGISESQSYNHTGMSISISLLFYYMICIIFNQEKFLTDSSFALFISFYGIFLTFLSQRGKKG